MKKRLLKILLFLLCLPLWGMAQQSFVSGKVIDEWNGEPLPGVNVLIKGSTQGSITDIEGNYRVEASSDDVLVFSYIGYLTEEVPVGQQNTINISLIEDILSLDEVVVTGYQTERKKDITGAVAVVDVEQMEKQAVANPMKALQGRVAGMHTTSNGSPSSPTTIRIRGIGTLNDNDPLFIIAGLPTKAGMHELNSADIESIQVLKDASAASIYGSRAANGVIIITTKKGEKGKPQITANAYTSLSSYAKRTEMLDTEGYGKA